jgi:hypothetical protein
VTGTVIDAPPRRTRPPRREPRRDLVATGKRWVALAVLLVLAGTAAGAWVGRAAPVHYTSEVRLAVGSTSLRALSVPGYVQATAQLASTYARYVDTSGQQLDAVAADVGIDGSDLVSLESTAIAASNVVRIRVEATTPEAATAAADAVAATLVDAVKEPNEDLGQLRRARTAASRRAADDQQRVTDAQAALDAAQQAWRQRNPEAALAGEVPANRAITAAEQTLSAARSRASLSQDDLGQASSSYRQLAAADPSRSEVSVIRAAAVVDDSRSRNVQWGALAGFAVGAVLGGLLLAVTVRRRSRVRG